MTTNEQMEYQVPIDWDALKEGCILSDNSVDLPPEVGETKFQWFACVLWDSQVAEELDCHEDWNCELHTTLFLGRLMSNRMRGDEELGDTEYWPGIEAMGWRRPFIMVDIIRGEFGTCGIYPCIRVQETNTINSRLVTGRPAIWDLVIFGECQPLATEMVRRFKDGVKTTVIIWAAHKSVYEKPWVDGEDHVRGEIVLRVGGNKEDVLSVLIYHRERISKERRYHILEANKESELWSGFQDDGLGNSWFCYSGCGGSRKENQLALHVIKKGTKGGGGGDDGDDEVTVEKCEEDECEDLNVQSFPNSTFRFSSSSTFTRAESLNDTKVEVDEEDEDTETESQYNFTELLDEL